MPEIAVIEPIIVFFAEIDLIALIIAVLFLALYSSIFLNGLTRMKK